MFQPWVEVWAPIKGDVIIGEEDRIVSELGVAMSRGHATGAGKWSLAKQDANLQLARTC